MLAGTSGAGRHAWGAYWVAARARGLRGRLMHLWASMAGLAFLWCCWPGPTLGLGPMHASWGLSWVVLVGWLRPVEWARIGPTCMDLGWAQLEIK